MNIKLLKAQMALNGKKTSEVAKLLGISKSAMYRKLNGNSDFTRKEICRLITCLGIETEKAMDIFFELKVS
ncbi:helix-turn-helix domain-containing protein [Clostridium estertheticum]|uniref:helix-turn-helix domain-containing protein n=1 Tax=Clostridium estertheticum TaxID=238834 RepID=UPI001C0AF7D2|nr:helix-turn-helix domain-containing protein [Clostridium estertheticum]MBU3185627.1 XRE family transcriptional regulator [Clostridium estertheticum]